MDGLVIQVEEFRTITPDELPVRIKTLRLGGWIENAEIRLRVTSGGRSPLPSAIIGGQIKIIQMQRKIALTPTPVDQQVLSQQSGLF